MSFLLIQMGENVLIDSIKRKKRKWAEALPAQVWVPVAPRRTPPMHTQSHHLRWSSSGSPQKSCPSIPQHEAPSPGLDAKDAPLSQCAPGSSHTGAVKKKNLGIYSANFFPLIPPLFALYFFLIRAKALAFNFSLLVTDWLLYCWSRIFLLTVNSFAFCKRLQSITYF